jgi:glycosidase
MTGWPHQPVIYEINTAIWLTELSGAAPPREGGRALTLAEVPAAAWDEVTPDGVDAVWLMGVWERSPAGRELANANAGLQAAFRAALPDLRPEDVPGSPYCVRDYRVDAAFGGPEALAAARAELASRGVRLILDYVPNHVAPDHPWVRMRPELFVAGTETDLAATPGDWLRTDDGAILAHGRDPYFPPWPDVVQLNAFSPALRAATTATLADIADQCDAIRCDMAMLATNQVFAKTWGSRSGPEPAEEFWPAVIGGLRVEHPDTVLIAEAYWDLEWELQQQGFDFCYDKRLYDRLVSGNVTGVRDHLRAGLGYQAKLLRFLENHDEPRIASLLPPDAERAAALAVATLPGAVLWHEGQFTGRHVHPPVFLNRRPPEPEPPDTALAAWYARLLTAVAANGVRTGDWRLLEAVGWPDNDSCRNLLTWSWSWSWAGDASNGTTRHIVVVNLSAAPAAGRIELPWPDLAGHSWTLTELLDGRVFDRAGDDLAGQGLFVDLPAWGGHLLALC